MESLGTGIPCFVSSGIYLLHTFCEVALRIVECYAQGLLLLLLLLFLIAWSPLVLYLLIEIFLCEFLAGYWEFETILQFAVVIPLLKARKVPFVAIGQPEDDQVLSVDHDQVGGCREMTSLLLMKGMKHIALLGGSMLYTVNQSRLEGFRQAYVKMGQKIDENLLFLELESDDLRMEAVQQAVERGADCILCMDERLAQLTLNMLKQLNLRVPQDIRLASLYDNENLVNTVPPISAVQFNADILGLKATQQLLCALQGQPVETRMELGYQVSLRESTQT